MCAVSLGVRCKKGLTASDTLGRSIDDAECEVWGWVCTLLIEEDLSEDDRWHELRGHVDECHINHLFYSYLGMPMLQPALPDYLEEIEHTPEERGWIHVPAAYESIEAFARDRPKFGTN